MTILLGMGRVFSYEQIKNGEAIPSADDFETAIGRFGDAANKEVDAGRISSAIIYGSVAIRAYTLRSDFDCMIVPFDHSIDSMDAILKIINLANPSGRIDMSVIVHPRSRLESGMHEIDRYFGDHLSSASRLVYGDDPADYIAYPDYGASTHLLAYLRHKKRSVSKGFVAQGDEKLKGLQRILELPLAIGRKTLRALDDINGSHFAISDSANKAKIMPASLELFDALELGDIPREILDLDKKYNALLQRVMNGVVEKTEYDLFLQEIQQRGGEASEWLDKLDTILVASDFRRG
jgi:hypothetical protein